MPSQKMLLPADYQAQMQGLDKEAQLAQALQQQSLQPQQGQMAGRFYVQPGIAQALSKVAQAYFGQKGADDATQKQQALGTQLQAGRGAKLAEALAASQGSPAPDASLGGGPAMPSDPTKGMGMLAQSQDPALISMGQPVFGAMQQRAEHDQQRQFQAQQAAARLADTQAARDAASVERADRTATQDQNRRDLAASQEALRRDLAGQQDALRRDLAAQQANNRPPVQVIGPDGKPIYVQADKATGMRPYSSKSGAALPPQILKLQNETIEEIGLAGSINSDLGALEKQFSDGKLKVGPVRNLANKALNFAGQSNEESRNFNSFQTTLEKLRNDSLRLNKGVQTEGDAQRAWAEMMGNINDPDVVRKRLGEIQRINQRAAAMKQMQLDQIRGNYNLDPLDTQTQFQQPAAVGAPSPANSGRRASDFRVLGVEPAGGR